MADAVRVIVHTGGSGLDEAAEYYRQFPWEPSPAGDLDLAQAAFTQVRDATLETLLDAMLQARTGGTVLLVCHAFAEGLLMPLVNGSRLSAGGAAITRLLEVSAAHRQARRIRALPATSPAEIQAGIEAWQKLIRKTGAGTIAGAVTLAELERLYETWLDQVARHELFLMGAPKAALLRLIDRVEKVQALTLNRVELRACNIGRFPAAMRRLRELFGCSRLLAPTVPTFYLKGVPVNTLELFGRRYIAEHRAGNFRPPGPAGRQFKDPADFVLEVVKKNPRTRLFWEYEYAYVPSENPHPAPNRYDGGTSTIKMRRLLAMIVEEVRPSYYRGSAATWAERSKGRPHWEDARAFVQSYIMRQADYERGSLTVAGFWTPDESAPWLLPNEPEYLEHITMVN